MVETDTTTKEVGKTFDITIDNGAAKKLQALMERFKGDELKVVALALELLSLLQNAEVVNFKNKTESSFRGVKIPDTVASDTK